MSQSPPIRTKTLRCAIYTRKSSEEGLEQSFNSLHAQREACEAYVKSQAHEGWLCLPDPYDDGGFSGGSMSRPGLERILADIAKGRIDVVVVYKVDRLTRSLTDFAKIVDAFDAKGVSFVSVTQAFNTTTSMGRLTLNVLLSFAQFEREVTGERIRDKIAASKAKGMWMGGNLPLGYDAGDHTLIVNEVEAEQVRYIFKRYLELGSVHQLAAELRKAGIRSKACKLKSGKRRGGIEFNRGALFHLLQNPHYRGLIRHKATTFPGLHKPIIDEPLFTAVQDEIASQRIQGRERVTRLAAAKLTGRIYRDHNDPMSPSFGYGKNARPYRYYIACSLNAGLEDESDAPRRLPGEPLEAFVLSQLQRLSGRPGAAWSSLDDMLRRVEVRRDQVHLVLNTEALFGAEHPELAMADLRARLEPGEQLLQEPAPAHCVRLVLAMRLQFRGGRTWITDGEGRPPRRIKSQDATLVRSLKAAHDILRQHQLHPGAEISATAKAPADPYDRKLCTLALLSPAIQRMILEGRQPQGFSLRDLIDANPPLAWADQEAWLDDLAIRPPSGPIRSHQIIRQKSR